MRIALLPVYPTPATLPVWLAHYHRSVRPVIDKGYAVICHENPEVRRAARALLEPWFEVLEDREHYWPHGDSLNVMLARCGPKDKVLLLEDDCFVRCPPRLIDSYFWKLDTHDFVGANDCWTSEPAQTLGMARFPRESARDPRFDSWGPGVLPTMFWAQVCTLRETNMDCNAVHYESGRAHPEVGLGQEPGRPPIGVDTMQWVMWQLRHQGKKQLRTSAYRLCPFPGIEVNGATPDLSISGWPWVHVGCVSYMSNAILGAPGSEATLCNSNLFEAPLACIRACMDVWQGRDAQYDKMIPAVQARIDKQTSWADMGLYEKLRQMLRNYLQVDA